MFERAKTGGQIIRAALSAFVKYPELLVPLLFSWILYAGIILYFHFSFDWNALSLSATLFLCFGIIFTFSSLLCFSASWLFEMIEQIETGQPIQLGTALSDTINANLIRMLPIALVWATIWFVLVIIDALTSKRQSKSNEARKLSFENATNLLAGTDSQFSWTRLSLDMAIKLVRMLVFLSLPAVCWRNMSGFSAMGEGLRTARKHAVEFFTGYVLTGAAAGLVFLPVALPAFLHSEKVIHIPQEVWPVMFVYLAFAWSFSIYIEQMFAAELYLWHMKWEKALNQARAKGAIEPKLSEVRRPSIIDDTPDLNASPRGRAVPINKGHVARQTTDLLKAQGHGRISCYSCRHEFQFSSHKGLEKYDYDLDAGNGIQLKCPSCGNITSLRLAKKRA